MTCETPCNGCTQQNECRKPLGDIEDYAAELDRLQKRSRELKELIANGKPRQAPRFRSEEWFNRKDEYGLSLVYMDRYLNFGLTKEELMSGKPIIGIAQTGSDIAPCNRHHLILAQRVREGIRSAGGIPLEFPTHPIQESGRRPSPTLDRNLLYLALVEILHGYPLDGIVLLTGCDKTAPACLMAAASMNIPSICLNVGPMLNGWQNNSRIGTGTVMWKARELHAAGQIDTEGYIDMVTKGSPSVGHCNTMGTASTMNLLAEALGMALPGSAAIPAPYRERGQAAYTTGVQIVEMAHQDRKPSDIMTIGAFENAIAANTAIGGSSNAPIHLIAIARHLGVSLDLDDWDRIGYSLPLLANVMPAGEMLMEEFFRAGGLPAVIAELHHAGALPHPEALTCNGRTMGENAMKQGQSWDQMTIKRFEEPLKTEAGFLHVKGNLFDSAIMKTSVISSNFRKEFLENPDDPNAFECPVAVFDGPEDYNKRLEHAPITAHTILVMRGVGPLGYPGAAEVVNMHAPGHLLKKGVQDLPCIGDGRQSGTSGCPAILNATPEAADGGNLAILRDGDIVRIDLTKRSVNILLPDEEIQRRRDELESRGGYHGPPSRTPWQDLFRREVGGLSTGMVMKRAVQFHRIAQQELAPRDNH
ncbi:unnamed protein product [Clonostachys rosea]|uniref:Dihydroxy-acid dehydratase n=1 Tax=Bionectria ochroleuca TaxID=29856 RepID=A0ABY6TZ14_BIOOC|nr:unnamed protein product [Clonostachys rosea]